jgi:hypothetical protein
MQPARNAVVAALLHRADLVPGTHVAPMAV